MLELVKGCHNRTGLTETVLVISISVCSTVSIGTLQGRQESVWFIQNFLLTVFVLRGLHCMCVCMFYVISCVYLCTCSSSYKAR